MIRINKNFAIFLGLTVILEFIILGLSQKFFLLLSHTVYYCQSYFTSLSLPIPYQIVVLPFIMLFALLGIAGVKLSIVLIKAKLLKRKLISNIISEKQFNLLLTKLHLENKTLLIESDNPFAFCLGMRRPKIYISTTMVSLMNEQELEAVLLHENYHLKNRDTLTMLIASISESLLPFFPLLSDLLRNYRIEREIKADREAINGLGKSEPIVSVLKKLLNYSSPAVATVSAIADQDTLEPRIKSLIKKDFHFQKFKLKHMVVSLVSFFVLSFLVIGPVQATDFHMQNEHVMMLCPYEDSCTMWCEDNKTVKPKNYSEENESRFYSPVH